MLKGTAVAVMAVAILVSAGRTYASGDLVAQRGGHLGGGRARGGQASMGIRALVEGRITAIEAASGRVTLELGGTVVQAQFSRDRTVGMQAGDKVFVTVELIDTRLATVTGAITAVDAASGAVTVATPRGPWTLPFSPGAVRDIAPGDQAVLKLEVVDIGRE